MNNKDIYIKLCSLHPIPIFSQYYWMDAVCGENNWDVILVRQNGSIVASLPYYKKNFSGFNEIRKAPLTQNNGVYIYYPDSLKYTNRITFENSILDILIDEIEQLGVNKYRQYYHYDFNNWLPFFWRGYNQTSRYTYVIEETSDLHKVVSEFSSNTRKNIRKAERFLTIEEMTDLEGFYELVQKTYSRQGLETPFSQNILINIYTKLKSKDLIQIYKAVDEIGNIHAAVLYIMDETSVYYLISGSDPNFRNSQSLTLLIYRGIQLACDNKKKFDFEGSMKKNIERFFRGFGAKQKIYFDIWKDFK